MHSEPRETADLPSRSAHTEEGVVFWLLSSAAFCLGAVLHPGCALPTPGCCTPLAAASAALLFPGLSVAQTPSTVLLQCLILVLLLPLLGPSSTSSTLTLALDSRRPAAQLPGHPSHPTVKSRPLLECAPPHQFLLMAFQVLTLPSANAAPATAPEGARVPFPLQRCLSPLWLVCMAPVLAPGQVGLHSSACVPASLVLSSSCTQDDSYSCCPLEVRLAVHASRPTPHAPLSHHARHVWPFTSKTFLRLCSLLLE